MSHKTKTHYTIRTLEYGVLAILIVLTLLWSLLTNSAHAQVSTLHNNCLGTGGLSVGLTTFLNSKFVSNWPTQNKCQGDIAVTVTAVGDLLSGNVMKYDVTVTNNGPRWSYSSVVAATFNNGLTTSTPTLAYGQMGPGTSQTQSLYVVKGASTPTTPTTATSTFTLTDSTITDTNTSNNTRTHNPVVRGSSRAVCRASGLTVPTYECEALMDLYGNTNGAGWTSKTNRGVSPNIESWFGLTTTQDDDLLAYYSFDASNATDDAGNGRNGTLVSSPSFAAGRFSNAASLNGVSYINLGSTINTGISTSAGFTINMWVNTSTTSAQNLFSVIDGTTNNFILLRKDDGNPDFRVRVNGSDTVAIGLNTEIRSGKWVMVTATYIPGGAVRLYVDGVLDNSTTAAGSNLNLGTITALIGRDGRLGGNPAFNGSMDEVRIYNRAISAAEVTQLYQKNTITENVRSLCLGHTNEQYVCNKSWETGGTASNNLAGTISDSVGDLSELVTLSLNKNAITGPIPTTIGRLKKLYNLFLWDTQISGSIPTEIGGATSLAFLGVSSTNLTGALPPSLASTNMNTMWGNATNINGLVPDLSSLAWGQFQFDDANLSGPLPAWLGNENVNYLRLGSNNFVGSIPSEWSNLNNLTYLSLNNNQLTGSLDVFSGISLTNMTTFLVQGNNLDRDHNNDAIVPANIAAKLSSLTSYSLANQGDITPSVIQYPLPLVASANYNGKTITTPTVTGPYGSSVTVAQYGTSPHHVFYSTNTTWGNIHTVPVANGETYTFGFWVRTTAGTRSITPRITENVNDRMSAYNPITIDTNWKYIAVDHTYATVGAEPRFFVDKTDSCNGASCADIQVFGANVTRNALIPQTIDGAFTYNLLVNENSSTTGAGFTNGLTISFAGPSICQQALITTDKILNKNGTTTIQVAALEPVKYEGCQIYITDRAGLQSNRVTLPTFTSNEYGICNTVTDITKSDCKALIDLYYATNGSGWTNKTNRRGKNGTVAESTPTTACDWFGVKCSGGRVSQLWMDTQPNALSGSYCGRSTAQSNNLAGYLPDSLGNLTGMTIFCAAGSLNLTGSLPSTFANIPLTHLFIHNNGLSGPLPQLNPALQYIYGYGNQFSGPLPTSWSNLTDMRVISLNYNPFNSPIPDSWSAMQQLRTLQMSSAGITGRLPERLGSLQYLTYIGLASNQLSGPIPNSLSSSPTLQQLVINDNNLQGFIPDSLANLTSLSNNSSYLANNCLSPSTSYMSAGLVSTLNSKFNSRTIQKTCPGSIGSRVWTDTNTNGLRDSTETGPSGVTVTLRACTDQTPVVDSLRNGLLAHYTFDNGLTTDSGPWGYTATNSGGVTAVAGKVGSAAQFNGTTSYLEIPSTNTSLIVGGDDISVQSRVKFNTFTAGGNINDRSVVVNEIGSYYLTVNTAGKVSVYLYGVTVSYIDSNASLTLNQRHHIAMSYDGQNIRIYINGILDRQVAISGTMIDISPLPLIIGGYGGYGRMMNGQIDDVRIYDRALSATEITTLYNITTPTTVSNLPISYAGTSVSSASSSAGAYSFAGVNPGKYYIEYTNIPVGYKFTTQNIGGVANTANSDVNPWSAKTSCFELYNGLDEMSVDAGLINLPYSSCETALPAYTPVLVGQPVAVSVAGYGQDGTLSISSTGNTNTALNKNYLSQTLTNQGTNWALKTWSTTFTPTAGITYTITGGVDGFTDRLEYYQSVTSNQAYRVIGEGQWCAVSQANLGPQTSSLTTINQIATIPSPIAYCTGGQTGPYAATTNQPPKMLVKVPACTSTLVATTDYNTMCDYVTDMTPAECKELVKLYDATEGWTQCATENNFCSFAGTRQVRYGNGGAYKYANGTNGISCNNATFTDPAAGLAKQCWYKVDAGTWTNETKWRFIADSTPRSACDWFGVTCVAGRVTSLNLSSNNLQNNLSGINWGVFTALTNLELYNNNLGGLLPDISGIPTLTTLRLGSNNFNGTLPSSWSVSPVLSELNLADAGLFTATVPSTWTGLSDTLTKLHLGSILVDTGAMPTVISSMTKLTELYLYDNKLTGALATQFSSMTGLKTLQLQSNSLYGNLQAIPLPQLTALYASSYGGNKSALDNNCLYTGGVSGTTGSFLDSRFNFGSLPVTNWRTQNYCDTDIELSTIAKIGNLMTGLTMTYIIDYKNLGSIPAYAPQLAITLHSGLYLMSGSANIATGSRPYIISLPQLLPGQTGQYSFVINKMGLGSGFHSIINQFSINDNYITDINPANNNFTDVDNARGSSYAVCVNPAITIQTYECESLGDLYTSTNGASWTTKTNWLSSPDVDTWHGISLMSLSGVNYVQKICMATANDSTACQDSWAAGTVGNNLSGSLPFTLGDLSQLTQFRAPVNKISGVIPAAFGNLDRVTHMVLHNNKITAIGTGIGGMAELTWLQLGSNPLTTIDTSIASAPKLSDLAFESTSISSLPNLTNLCDTLTTLSIHNNSSLNTTIPTWLSGCTKLQTLNAYSAGLTGTITNQFAMPSLQYLRINDNNLNGSLPTSLSTGLIDLTLQNNKFTGTLPTQWSSLTKLETLRLDGNTGISSTLSSTWSTINKLKILNLSGATIQGEIPTTWSSMTQMNEFIIPNTQLDGPLPIATLQAWPSLKTGPITSTINNNCLYTGLLTTPQVSWMSTFLSWQTQRKCDANLQITLASKSSPDFNPGKTIIYTINYANNGPRWSYEPVINVTLNTGIFLSGTTSTTTGIKLPMLAPGQTGQVLVTANKRGTGQGTGIYVNEMSIFDPMTKDGLDFSGLIAHYTFDNSDARDDSYNSNNGVVDGATFVPGKVGMAASFDGINDKIDIPSNPFNNIFTPSAPSFTISAWIKTNRTSGFYEDDSAGPIFGQRYGDSLVFGYWGGATAKAGKLFLNIDDTRGGSPTSNSVVNTNTWKQVTVVGEWTGSTQGKATFYIDGAVDRVVTWNAPITNQNMGYIGYDGRYLTYFQGLIDDLRIYNRALSAAEVSQLAAAGGNNTLTDTGVIRWFKYNECIDVTDVPQVECEALMDLYTYTAGASWTTKTNWAGLGDATQATLCDWYGVTCVGGRVTNLCLAGSNTATQCLHAWSSPGGNNLSGSLQITMGDLTELTGLFLGSNKLSGPIPTQVNQLTKLTNLSLGGNKFTVLPTLSGLQQLQWLHLNDNQFTAALPTWIAQMPNLSGLTLYKNQFTGPLPTSWTGASKLWYLSMSDNPSLAGSSLPTSWSSWSSLREVYMNSNGFTSILPTSWSSLSGLTKLSLYNNQIVGNIPSNRTGMRSLQALNLGINSLTGSLPTSWSSLTGLKDLRLNNNNFTGTSLPTSWSSLTNLEYLDIAGSSLIGTLPSSRGALNKLQTLRINSNSFLDDIPMSWFTGMTAMRNFIAYDNDLGGPIDVASRQNWGSLSTNGSDSVISNNCLYTGSVVGGYLTWMDTYFGAQQIKPASSWAPQYYWKNQRRCPADLQLTGLVVTGNLYTGAFMTYTFRYENKGVSWAYNPTVSVVLHSGLSLLSGGRSTSISLGYLRPYASGQIVIPIMKTGVGSGTEIFTNTFAISDTASDDNVPANNIITHTGVVKWFKYAICGIVQDISQVECEALGDFYTDLGGTGWTNKTYWMGINDPTDTTACDWFGITCVADNSGLAPKTVDTLCMSHTNSSYVCNQGSWYNGGITSNNLSGSLPASIADLKSLTSFSVTANTKVIGTLPNNIGDLTKLQVLGFNYGPKLTGTLPSSMKDMVALNRLGLFGNNTFGTLPTGLLDLPNLATIWIDNNQLTGSLPTSSSSPLNDFYLWGNSSLGGSIPSWLTSKSTLTWLRIGGTALSGSLPALTGTNLYHVDMSSMPNLKGSLPSEWSSLGTKVNTIRLQGNPGLTGSLPPSWSSLTNLVEINLAGSNIQGSLPTSWSSLNKLTNLRLDNNNLQGEIPTSWSTLNKLTNITLANNNIDGVIPTWLPTSYTGLTNNGSTINNNCMYTGFVTGTFLTYMNTEFGSNWQAQKTCSTDPMLVGATTVGSLQTSNSVTYTVNYKNNGSRWLYLPKITVNLYPGLAIGTTTGTVISQLPPLAPGQSGYISYTINKNYFTQTGLVSYTNTYTISDVTISDTNSTNNTLTQVGIARGSQYEVCRNSALTVTQGECESLMDFYNANNGTSWTNGSNRGISTNVSTWFGVTTSGSNVTKLNLSNSTDKTLSCDAISSGNNVSGVLTTSIGGLVSLTDLCLGNNQLTGAVSPSINAMVNLKILSLHHNSLSSISSTITGLPQLEKIDLSYNKLQGSIDVMTDALPQLKYLRYDHNQLSNGLYFISKYNKLQSVRLNNNIFMGGVPTSWTGLSYVTELNLSSNNLDRDNTNSAIIPTTLANRYNSVTVRNRDNQGDVTSPVISNMGTLSGSINAIGFPITFTINENSYASGLYTSGSLSGQTLSGLYIVAGGGTLCNTISSDPIVNHTGAISVMIYPETDGSYVGCTFTIRDRANNSSNSLTIPTFTYTQPPYRLHLMMGGSGVVLNNGSLQSVKDLSPFNHNITMAGGNPVYVTNALNGNPAIQFNSGQSLMMPGIFRKQRFDDTNILIIVKPGSVASDVLLEQGQTGFPVVLSTNSWTVLGSSLNFSTPASHQSLITAMNSVGGNQQVRINGSVVASLSTNQAIQNSGISITKIGAGLSQGLFAEIIVYTKGLDVSSLNYLESYLALKYGITLPGNYTALLANNTIATVWSSNQTYQHQVVGLGRQLSGSLLLDQNISTAASGSTVTLHARGNWTNGQYAIVGSNSGALARTRTIAGFTGYKAVERTWYVKKTGSNPLFDISVTDTSIASFNFAPTIIVSSSPTFSTITSSGVLVHSGDRWISSGVVINDGQYVTFAIAQSSMGGRVWLDLNRDGIQSPSEPSLSGVKVSLWKCPINNVGYTQARYLGSNQSSPLPMLAQKTTTLGSVNYLFSDINPGDYYMTYDWSTAQITSPSLLTGTKNAAKLPGSYSGGPLRSDYEQYKGRDLDKSSMRYGLMDSLSGVALTSLDSDMMSSDFSPDYLPQSSKCYTLEAGTNQTQIGAGLMRTTSTDISLTQSVSTNQVANTSGVVSTFNLTLTATNNGQKESYYTQIIAELSPYVTIDNVQVNGQSAGYILSGSQLKLYLNTLNPSQTKTYVVSLRYNGLSDDGNSLTFKSKLMSTTLDTNTANNTPTDVGVLLTRYGASIGDKVWIDANRNGIQDDSSSSTLSGIMIELHRASDGELVKTAKFTTSNGSYLFTSVSSGQYYIFVTNLPKGYIFTNTGTIGSTSANDSNINPATNRSDVFTVVDGVDNLSIDIGLMTINPLAQCTSVQDHKMRLGQSYSNFTDVYVTNIAGIRLFSVDRVRTERADHNNSTDLPIMRIYNNGMRPGSSVRGYLAPGITQVVIRSNENSYTPVKAPRERGTTGQMVVSYNYLGCMVNSALPAYCLQATRYNSCHTYEITSCGDGIVDQYDASYLPGYLFSEQCDNGEFNNGSQYNGVRCNSDCTISTDDVADLGVIKTDIQRNLCTLPSGSDGTLGLSGGVIGDIASTVLGSVTTGLVISN